MRTSTALTLNQAARACKRSKSTLLNALNSGLLSGGKDDRGNWSIEPAELFRVYQPEPSENHDKTSSEPFQTSYENHYRPPIDPVGNHIKTAVLEAENRLLREMVDDLKIRLDRAESERQQLTLMLTHKPEPKEPLSTQSDPNTSTLYRRLFKRGHSGENETS